MPSLSDVKVTISTDANLEGINKVNESLGRMTTEAEAKVSGLSKSTAAMAGLVAGAVQTLAMQGISMISSTIDDAVHRVDTLNNAKRSFENMGFGAQQADGMMKNLTASILGLPTALNDAVSGVEMLTASTNDMDKSQKIFSALNDGIIGFGGSSAMVENAIIQISQAFSNGKVDAQTWNSMMQSGLGPVLNSLAKQLGVTTGALKSGLSDGSISVGKFQDALIELDQKGGGGLTSLQKIAHDSTDGIGTGFANMKTAITRGLADILTAIGTKNISNAIANIGKALEQVGKKIGEFIKGADFKEFMHTMKDIFLVVLQDIKKAWDNLQPSIKALTDTFTKEFLPVLSDFWKNYGPQIKNILKDLGILFGVTLYAAVWLVINTVNILLKSFDWIYKAMKDGNPIIWALAGMFGVLAGAMAFNAVFNALTVGFTTLRLITIPSVIASVEAMQAVILLPMVMPAIAVGAAIAALVMVQDAANKARVAVEGAQTAANNATASNQAVIKNLNDLMKNGTADQKARAKAAMANLAANGSFASGGFTGIGGSNEVAGVVHKGEYVLPQSAVDQHTGMPKANGGSNVTTNFYGNITLGDSSAVSSFFNKLDQDILLSKRGLTPNRGLR